MKMTFRVTPLSVGVYLCIRRNNYNTFGRGVLRNVLLLSPILPRVPLTTVIMKRLRSINQ